MLGEGLKNVGIVRVPIKLPNYVDEVSRTIHEIAVEKLKGHGTHVLRMQVKEVEAKSFKEFISNTTNCIKKRCCVPFDWECGYMR